MMKKIIIASVNHNSYTQLYNFLTSVDKAAKRVKGQAIVEVFVGDNSTSRQVVDYKAIHYRLSVLVAPNNGYLGTVRYLLRQRPDIMNADFFIISNVDVFLTTDCFSNLLSFVSQNNDSRSIGWIAPAIISETLNCDLNPQATKRYSLNKLRLLRIAYTFPFIHRLYTLTLHKAKNKTKSHQPADIYAGHGSFIILTRAFLQHCPSLDYPIFLYGEEIFLAEQCAHHRLLVKYVPSIVIFDIGKVSTGKMPSSFYYRYNRQAMDYLINTFYLR